MQYFGCSVNIIFVIVALLLFQRIFLFHVQFVNGMNTSYVQIRNELASEQLIKVQFQVAMSGRYSPAVTVFTSVQPRKNHIALIVFVYLSNAFLQHSPF